MTKNIIISLSRESIVKGFLYEQWNRQTDSYMTWHLSKIFKFLTHDF